MNFQSRLIVLGCAVTLTGCGGAAAGGFLVVVLVVVVAALKSLGRPRGARSRPSLSLPPVAPSPSEGRQTKAPVDSVPESDGEEPSVSAVESRQRAFVRERIEAHRQAYLRHEIWRLGSTQGIDEVVVARALNGHEPRLAAPVLALFHDDWMWKKGQLRKVTRDVVADLGMALPELEGKPTDLACDACRDWARAEAARLLRGALGESP